MHIELGNAGFGGLRFIGSFVEFRVLDLYLNKIYFGLQRAELPVKDQPFALIPKPYPDPNSM